MKHLAIQYDMIYLPTVIQSRCNHDSKTMQICANSTQLYCSFKNISSTILLISKRLIANEDRSLKLDYLSTEEVLVNINKLAYPQKGT